MTKQLLFIVTLFARILPEEKTKTAQTITVERSSLVEHTGLELIRVCPTKDKKSVFSTLFNFYSTLCPPEADSF